MAKIKVAVENLVDAWRAAAFVNTNFSDEIKEKTRIYRTTWILPQIENAIVAINPCPTCKGQRYIKSCLTCGGYGSLTVQYLRNGWGDRLYGK